MRTIGLTHLYLRIFLGILFPFLLSWDGLRADFGNDLFYWETVKFKEKEAGRAEFLLRSNLRFRDSASELETYQISQLSRFRLGKNFKAGLNYTFDNTRIDGGRPWNHTHRLEIEALNRVEIANSLPLSLRNRIEFRWKEGSGGTVFPRYRFRFLISRPARFLPGMAAIETGNEVFYDFKAGDINQNRFQPLRMRFKINKKLGITLFYLLWSKKTAADGWQNAHVIGTEISLSHPRKRTMGKHPGNKARQDGL